MASIKLYYGPIQTYVPTAFDVNLTSEGVLVATFNNPTKLNSLDGTSVAEVFFIIEHAERDPAVKVLVWTGAGRAFSAGANFAKLQISKSSPIYASMEAYTKAGKGLLRVPDVAMKSWLYRMLEFNKISICAVNGIAIGGGANFALLMHDFVFAASDEAKFRYPFSELGIPPEMGSSFLFPRLFAKRYIMTGDWFGAAEAEKMGLVYKIVSPQTLMNVTLSFATKLAQNESLQGMNQVKRIINDRTIDQLNHYRVCDIENETIDRALVSEYTQASVQRFIQKHGRKPSKL